MSHYGGPPNNQYGGGNAGYYDQQGQGYYPLSKANLHNRNRATTHHRVNPNMASSQDHMQQQGPPQGGPGYDYGQPQNRDHSPYPPEKKQGGESSSYYGTAPQPYQQGPPGAVGPEGERGLGSTLLGGAAGGFVGNKMGHGFLGTAGGAVLGAVGANMASHKLGFAIHDLGHAG
ncbi:hypothetical protein N7535_002980 [Penicillium sp. DV-2018c]|nr:hypothetical protein N7535_002980 [Penicillium sp. DV-2018c]